VILGETGESLRKVAVEQGISGSMAIREGDWKYIPSNRGNAADGMGSGADPNDPRFAAAIIRQPLLFNLATDPDETNNLATQYPAKVVELANLLKKIEGHTVNSSGMESPKDWAGSD
jgi:hypothetical protein